MKVAIISRPGGCFPNIISQGLVTMLNELKVETKIFHDGISLLMRILPLNEKPIRWHNKFHFRIRNKIRHYRSDLKLMKELNKYDAVIISECYPNAFWRNYFAIDEFRKHFRGKIISYTEAPLDAAPQNKSRLINDDDYKESIYDYNLYVTDIMEVRKKVESSHQSVIGINISHTGLVPDLTKKKPIALVDFAQPGYEIYRDDQINALKQAGISTIILEKRYTIAEIRELYTSASLFFLSFPETFGLPIAECLACGTYIFTPSSAWPMSWRLDEQPGSFAPGTLPGCFKVYNGRDDLYNQLLELKATWNPVSTPTQVAAIFLENYPSYYYGNLKALQHAVESLRK